MKHTIAFLSLLLITSSVAFSQNNNRYEISLIVSVDGKDISLPASSFNYSVTYDTWNTPSPVAAAPSNKKKEAATPAPDPASEFKYFFSITLKQIPKELLAVISKPNHKIDGRIIRKDRFSKETERTVAFKEGRASGVYDSFTEYEYEGAAGTANLSISCKQLVIDGVEFK